MDRRELSPGSLESLMVFGERLRSELWTSLPGIIQSYDATKQTCTVQPALQFEVTDQFNKSKWVNMPLLVDCPVFFPSGGGLVLTFPVAAGDECLVLFANRCIDAWWQQGGIQVQAEFRMHDLSDGMVLPGFDSVPNVAPSQSGTQAQLRNHSGDTFVGVDATGHVTVTASASVTVTAPGITLNGPVTVNGSLTASGTIQAPLVKGTTDVQFGTHSGNTHVHSGVTSGSSNSGGPI